VYASLRALFVIVFAVTKFYENVMRMKMLMEKTYFDLAEKSKDNCLVICDGGTMDIKARKCRCRLSCMCLRQVQFTASLSQVCDMSFHCRVSAYATFATLSLRFNGHFPDEPELAGVY